MPQGQPYNQITHLCTPGIGGCGMDVQFLQRQTKWKVHTLVRLKLVVKCDHMKAVICLSKVYFESDRSRIGRKIQG